MPDIQFFRQTPLSKNNISDNLGGPHRIHFQHSGVMNEQNERHPGIPDPGEKKKGKKWNISSFFRRKNKKQLDIESSDSNDESKNGFLSRKRSGRRHRIERRKNSTNGFDVIVNGHHQFSSIENVGKATEELWSGNRQRAYYEVRRRDSSLSRNSCGGSGSLDGRRSRKELKARVEAKRDELFNNESSSDENNSAPSNSSYRLYRLSRQKLSSGTPSPSQSPRVRAKHAFSPNTSSPVVNSSKPLTTTLNKPCFLEYENYLSLFDSKNKSLSYDQDIHRAKAMYINYPQSSSQRDDMDVHVPPLPPPRNYTVPYRVDSTLSLSVCEPTYEKYYGPYNRLCNYPIKSNEQIYHNYSNMSQNQSVQEPIGNLNDCRFLKDCTMKNELRYYADQQPRSRNPIHIICNSVPTSTSVGSSLNDSMPKKTVRKDYWIRKDHHQHHHQHHHHQETINPVNYTQYEKTVSSSSSRSTVHSPKSRHSAILIPQKIQLCTKVEDVPSINNVNAQKMAPEPPVRRHSHLVSPLQLFNHLNSNLDDALNELESVYSSLKRSSPSLRKMNNEKVPASSAMRFDDYSTKEIIEPNIILDDVVFRNLRYSNNLLKTADPQPPFGIPIGPVSAASKSDYLHLIPNKEKSRNSKIPDLVNDDLAFRNLRKDRDIFNRRRVVRSTSENLYSIICNQYNETFSQCNGNDKKAGDRDKAQSLDNLNPTIKELSNNNFKATDYAQDERFFNNPTTASEKEGNGAFIGNMRDKLDRKNGVKSPIVELSKYPAAIPTSSLNPFKESHLPDDSLLDELLSKMTFDKKEESIDKRMIKSEKSSLEDIISFERNLNGIKIEPELSVAEEVSVNVHTAEVIKVPSAFQQSSNINKTKEKSRPHKKSSVVTGTNGVNDELFSVTNAINVINEIKDSVDRDSVLLLPKYTTNNNEIETSLNEKSESESFMTAQDEAEDVEPITSGIENSQSLSPIKLSFKPVSDVADILDSAEEPPSESETFQKVFEYNCALSSSQTSDDVDQSRLPKSSHNNKDGEASSTSCSYPRPSEESADELLLCAVKVKGKMDSGKELSEGETTTTRERIERYKDRRRQELNALYGFGDGRREKTDIGQGERSTMWGIRETKTSRLRAAASQRTAVSKQLEPSGNAFITPVKKDSIEKGSPKQPHSNSLRIKASPEKNNSTDSSENGITTIDDGSRVQNVINSSTTGTLSQEKGSGGNMNNTNCVPTANEYSRKYPTSTTTTTQPCTAVGVPSKRSLATRVTGKSTGNESSSNVPIINLKSAAKVPSTSSFKSTSTASSKLENSSTSLPTQSLSPNESTLTKPSILKKKLSLDEAHHTTTNENQLRPSILKRKTFSQDGSVTFSPAVIEKESVRKNHGILKKHRSLDEGEVIRRRSFSPDKSILKNDRRSSLEELTSILKRDSCDALNSLEPQSILKRKSSSSTPIYQHVTIADTVIIAVAEALGDLKERQENEGVRPILKKKSLSEDGTTDTMTQEVPRPILKKRSTDSDEAPVVVRPILKSSRKSSEEDLPSASILKTTEEGSLSKNSISRRTALKRSHERARSAPPQPRSFDGAPLDGSASTHIKDTAAILHLETVSGTQMGSYSDQPNVADSEVNVTVENPVQPTTTTNSVDTKAIITSIVLPDNKDNPEISQSQKRPYKINSASNLNQLLRDVCFEASERNASLRKNHLHRSSPIYDRNKSAGHKISPDSLEYEGGSSSGLKRSTTQPMDIVRTDEDSPDLSGLSIKERLARLRKNGETGWRKRHTAADKNSNDISNVLATEVINGVKKSESHSSILATRRGQLEIAQESWKSRIQTSDAVKFTVEGKLTRHLSPTRVPVGQSFDLKRNTPKQRRFRSQNNNATQHSDPSGKPLSPTTTHSFTADYGGCGEQNTVKSEAVVTLPISDDDTFASFFQVPTEISDSSYINIQESDFDFVQRHPESSLLVQRRNVWVHRRHKATRNPIKSLASRSDIMREYTEVKTGVAERELKRLQAEKFFTPEALAGLASREDYSSVSLKKPISAPTQYPSLMLVKVKGRRHVESRLVEPCAKSVNEGDCYLLVTPDVLAMYVGALSNVVERARIKDIASKVEAGDLDTYYSRTCGEHKFWSILGVGEPEAAGPPDEDEIFEIIMSATNMVYELVGHELVPVPTAWGLPLKYDLLHHDKILIFDFGSEMYVWNGKRTSLALRSQAESLAKELWDQGFDYSECDISPLGSLTKGEQRPSWALFCIVKQNMEPVLFREKFVDWPDDALKFRRSLFKGTDGSSVMDVQPCDAAPMIREITPYPDLMLEGSHLGRGKCYFDEETRRWSEIATVEVTRWRVSESSESKIENDSSLGQFYSDESSVVRWHYSVAITVRELGGQPSKHVAPGRDRFCYFTWHGIVSSAADRGAAACFTVSLDKENAPQLTLVQFREDPAFRQLFDGTMTIHRNRDSVCSLYLILGVVEEETVFIEVDQHMKSLRSRASFLLVNRKKEYLALWFGCCASKRTKEISKLSVTKILDKRPVEFRLPSSNATLNEIVEGEESSEFLESIEGTRENYYSILREEACKKEHCPKVFHMSSKSGEFMFDEVSSPLRHPQYKTQYSFLQSDLYEASQPALFLVDAGTCLWLWQGWVKEDAPESTSLRFQAERRAAMQTALDYLKCRQNSSDFDEKTFVAKMVWAGHEPLEFIALFPLWARHDDVAIINEKEMGGDTMLDLSDELARLTCTQYPLSVLMQRPLPDGVDPTQLEDYLNPDAFPDLFEMTKAEFQELPLWKKTFLKKKIGLF